jgi:hypothetical protein
LKSFGGRGNAGPLFGGRLSQSSSSFGKITATVGSGVATAVGTTAGVVGGGPRVIQAALRVEF